MPTKKSKAASNSKKVKAPPSPTLQKETSRTRGTRLDQLLAWVSRKWTSAKQGGLFVIAKYTAFITFSVVSTLLSLNMFYQLVDAPLEKLLLTITAGSVEIFKIYKLVQANTLYALGRVKLAIKAYVLYAFIALASLTASYGFTLNAVTRGVVSTSSNTTSISLTSREAEKTRAEAQILRINKEILDAETKLAAADKDVVDWSNRLKKIEDVQSEEYKTVLAQYTRAISAQRTAQGIFDKTISPLRSSLSSYENTLTTISTEIRNLQITSATEAKTTTTTSTMFALMAQAFSGIIPGITEAAIRFGLLLLISLIIEVGIISTSPHTLVEQKYLHHFIKVASANAPVKAPSKISIFLSKIFGERKVKDPPLPPLPAPAPVVVEQPAVDLERLHSIETLLAEQQAMLEKIGAQKTLSPQEMLDHLLEKFPPGKITPKKEEAIPSVLPLSSTPSTLPMPAPPPEDSGLQVTALVQTAVPIRTPVPEITEEEEEKKPEQVYTYRFGKTTETVKNQFVDFVNALFASPSPWDAEHAETAGHLHEPMGKIFLSRLTAMKGANNIPLVQPVKMENGRAGFSPNFAKDYIINYATARKEK